MRDLFQLDPEVVYLNCAYMSPQLKSVSQSGHAALQRKEQPWLVGPEDFFSGVEKLRSRCSQLINTKTDNIALIPSASYGLATAANFIKLGTKDKVLVLAEQFPSHVYVWQEKCKQSGSEMITVERPVDFDWTNAILKYQNQNIRILALPACHWTDGSRIDLARIRSAFSESMLVVDGSQYVGAQAIDVGLVDILVTVGYKWLFGPYSLGFMYVSDEYLDHDPIEFNWTNKINAEDFAGLVQYKSDYAPGARRFDVGEKANFILVPMLTAALDWLLDLGVEGVAQHNGKLLKFLIDELSGTEVSSIPERFRSQHMTGLYFPTGNLAALQAILKEQKIFVSTRGNCIRVSPHLYNNLSDVTRFVQVVKKFIND